MRATRKGKDRLSATSSFRREQALTRRASSTATRVGCRPTSRNRCAAPRQYGDVLPRKHAFSERFEPSKPFSRRRAARRGCDVGIRRGDRLPDVRARRALPFQLRSRRVQSASRRRRTNGSPAEIHCSRRARPYPQRVPDRLDAPRLASGCAKSTAVCVLWLAETCLARGRNTEIAEILGIDRVRRPNDRLPRLRIFSIRDCLKWAKTTTGRASSASCRKRRIDMERNERYAEGEATREAFSRFCAACALRAGPKRSNACSTGPSTLPTFSCADRPRLREDARHRVFIDVPIKSVLRFNDAAGCPRIDLVARRRKMNGRPRRVGISRASERCELVAFAVR